MAQHPLNLLLRFLLELALLAALAYWGWARFTGVPRVVLAVGVPLVGAVLWGVFRVPGDGGPPVVEVPGWVRLGIEAVLFTAAVLALSAAGRPRLALVLGVVSAIHYALSYDRLAWLLKQ